MREKEVRELERGERRRSERERERERGERRRSDRESIWFYLKAVMRCGGQRWTLL